LAAFTGLGLRGAAGSVEYPALGNIDRQEGTLEIWLTPIVDLGFGAIDLVAFENWQHVNPSELAVPASNAVAEVVDAVAKFAMSVTSINAGPSVSVT